MFKDPILKQLIKKYPAPEWVDRSEFLFEDMIDTIISQQLSGKAAESIFKKFKALFINSHFDDPSNGGEEKSRSLMFPPVQLVGPRDDKVKTFPTPEEVLAIGEGSIKNVGVSQAKARYINNVAEAFVNKEIVIEEIKNMSDEEIILHLTNIKGIGKWSAEMILIFTLNRPDVFSIGDLGLRNAIKNLYNIESKEEILKLTETWKPNRSLACWYLWRSLENK